MCFFLYLTDQVFLVNRKYLGPRPWCPDLDSWLTNFQVNPKKFDERPSKNDVMPLWPIYNSLLLHFFDLIRGISIHYCCHKCRILSVALSGLWVGGWRVRGMQISKISLKCWYFSALFIVIRYKVYYEQHRRAGRNFNQCHPVMLTFKTMQFVLLECRLGMHKM